MQNYLLINITLSLLILVVLKYGKGSNDANYYLSLIGLIIWFIPYSLIASILPDAVLVEPEFIEFSTFVVSNYSPNSEVYFFDSEVWAQRIMLVLMSIGLFALFIRQVETYRWKKQLMSDGSLTFLHHYSYKNNVKVYSATQPQTGFLVGILNPIIVISNKVNKAEQIELIISHEKQHLEHKDNFRLLLLQTVACTFWWNPFVQKLIAQNRFFIEARCDEKASLAFGKNRYIENLAELMLNSQTGYQSPLACSATSSINNNVARLKLLKENRKMSIRKKFAYSLLVLTTIITTSWHTYATAINGDSQMHKEDRVGALVDFDIKVSNWLNEETENTQRAKVSMWVDFDKQASFKISEHFRLVFKVANEGDLAGFETEIVEISPKGEKTVAKPQLKTLLGKQAIIEIDNKDISNNTYLIKLIANKAKLPSSD